MNKMVKSYLSCLFCVIWPFGIAFYRSQSPKLKSWCHRFFDTSKQIDIISYRDGLMDHLEKSWPARRHRPARPSSVRTDSPSNLSEGTALSIVGGTWLCSFLNFSKAFLLISSFCTGSATMTKLVAHQSAQSNFCLFKARGQSEWSRAELRPRCVSPSLCRFLALLMTSFAFLLIPEVECWFI